MSKKKMNHYEFIENAKKTESVVDSLKINRHYLSIVILMHIEVTEMLDGIKKQAFYNNPKKLTSELSQRLVNINELSGQLYKILQHQGHDGLLNQEHVDYLDTRICHGIIGIMTESGELGQALHKALETGEFDEVNVLEELFDGDWYKAITTDAMDADWSDQWERIIAKLKARFGDKFSEESANNRDVKKERKILENKD
jgi:hypothetical protein